MEWQPPGLAELRAPNQQCACRSIEVLTIQAARLPDTHPGGCQQADQRPVGRGSVRRAKRPGGVHQRRDLRVGVEVWRGAVRRVGQQPGRWHLVRGVDAVQVGRKTAHDSQPHRAPRIAAAGKRRPRERVLGRDPRLAPFVQVSEELAEQLLGARELVAERAAHRQIVVQRITQRRIHDAPPGQERAMVRKASTSTFA
jgi:hypothetical protein